jgi:hypothetical protein
MAVKTAINSMNSVLKMLVGFIELTRHANAGGEGRV